MTKFSDIKGFAFDLDGVITDTAKFHTQAWHALADQVNVTWTPELQESLKGIDRMGSLEMTTHTMKRWRWHLGRITTTLN